MAQERVGFIGVGSVGISSLRLMLKCLPHPKEIILCDIYSKLEYLKEIRQELFRDLGFQGDVRIAGTQTKVPPEIYDATFLLSSCFENLEPTIGTFDWKTSFKHYELLSNLGFMSADLHCGDYVLPEKLICNFRHRFGN
ncbi:MAG: hypothetical protein HWQ35_15155 [Nostoc sp. NMS1]|uniref:hypothetical protein n=1 Tax=unclassified Nostoc TaxID=2593658 RepID=UPI0025DEA537|nr:MULTISPECIES: hypothetical protein [unclassified Nostoc]MBN3907844.1 hypothetical protein [Nostoc sp. NMS1]MBN3991145.1 hypothetical protein [Nostoc sp. NMS2]